MAKIAIDLLPIEFKQQDVRNSRFLKVQTVGVIVILFVIFLASLTVALRVLQSQNISRIQSNLTRSEQKVSGLKDTQDSLHVLKDRVTTINQYLGTPSEQTQIFNIVTKLLPQSGILNSLSVSHANEVLILVSLPDGNSIDVLISRLTSSQYNEGRITQVEVENINRGRDGVYRVSLKIKTDFK